MMATGEAIPLRGLEGVPGLPGAPQDEAGLTSAPKSFQSCPTLCDPIEGSPPGPAVPGVL